MKTKNLVIVESPTKAKTIGRILGDNFSIVSSMGHLIDLPQKELGVDIENGFKPHYVVIPRRKKVLSSLKKDAQDKDMVYVATDPDREGEAIGWHIKEQLFKDKKVLRVIFHEITPSAVLDAFRNPRGFDLRMIEAQVSRRVLDRIVGYFLSPLLWKKLARGLSAGRVQSVALRLIVEREKKISNFVPEEYWEIEAELKKKTQKESFLAKLEKIKDKPAQIKNQAEADKLVGELREKQFKVLEVKKTEKKRNPEPPFITSTLQQKAFNWLGFNGTKTMIIAQQLYEGIDIQEAIPVGLITYMRTDSTQVAAEATREVRNFILKNFGKDYLPSSPNVYKAKKYTQAAHEAIRPTSLARTPESLKGFLTADQYKLYKLIYNRFLASQMTPARYLVTTVDIIADDSGGETYLFISTAGELIFAGFKAAYGDEHEPENDAEEKKKNKIPSLEKDEILDLLKLIPSQHFTKPPARFSDSSLVKILEEEGIGRPSTYAPIIQTLILRDYARRLKGYFYPTELGSKVCDLLVKYFPKIIDVKFTAYMEEGLDDIEEGKIDRIKVLEDFYTPFKVSLDFAQKNIPKELLKTNELCERCGRAMVIKWGRKGKFLSCSGFPKCKNAKTITSGVKCPQPDCLGELVERRGKRGFFFGCSTYPKCKFTSRTLPEEKEQKQINDRKIY